MGSHHMLLGFIDVILVEFLTVSQPLHLLKHKLLQFPVQEISLLLEFTVETVTKHMKRFERVPRFAQANLQAVHHETQ